MDIEKPKIENLSHDLSRETEKETQTGRKDIEEIEKETINKQREIKEIVDAWLERIRVPAEERATHFGIERSETDRILDHIYIEMSGEFFVLNDPDVFDALKTQTGALLEKLHTHIKKHSDYDNLRAQTENMSLHSLFGLLVRKLKAEATGQELHFLDIISHARYGSAVGIHDTRLRRIEIRLLNAQRVENYDSTLMHELTHYGLNHTVPEALTNTIFEGSFFQESGERQKVGKLFFSLTFAVNESAAHRAERFNLNEGGREPYYIGYRSQVSPKLFELVYRTISEVAIGKTLGEFDVAMVRLYRLVVGQWRPDLTIENVNQIAISFIQEAHQLKGSSHRKKEVV